MSEVEFDNVALKYDDTFTNTVVGRAQRKLVWKNIKLVKDRSLNILELNCGTGEDALFLSEEGHRVIATDISEKMVEVTRNKLQHSSSQATQLDIKQLENFQSEQKFDLIFSNFGGLNCLNSEQLQKLSKSAHQLLEEKGSLIMVLMTKNCLWEKMYFNFKGEKAKAKRRNTEQAISVEVEGKEVDTYYYSPQEIISLFKDHFKVVQTKPIGFFVPPSYLNPWFENRKGIFNLLFSLDRLSSGFSFLSDYADHFLIELQKK